MNELNLNGFEEDFLKNISVKSVKEIEINAMPIKLEEVEHKHILTIGEVKTELS